MDSCFLSVYTLHIANSRTRKVCKTDATKFDGDNNNTTTTTSTHNDDDNNNIQ